MNTNLKKIVPLARFARIHGKKCEGFLFWKCDLFSPCAPLIRDSKIILVGKDQNNLNQEFEIIEVEPLGAKWEEARSIRLKVPENSVFKKGDFLGLARDQLPKLNKGESYLFDYLGADLLNGEGIKIGKIVEAQQLSKKGPVVLEAQVGAKIISFPLDWVDQESSEKHNWEKVFVPDIEKWLEVSESKNDPDDL